MRVTRARYASRKTADAGSGLDWPRIVFTAAFILILAAPANPQEAANVGALSGTLKKVKDTGTITLGYRESSCQPVAEATRMTASGSIAPDQRSQRLRRMSALHPIATAERTF